MRPRLRGNTIGRLRMIDAMRECRLTNQANRPPGAAEGPPAAVRVDRKVRPRL
jgi:hypothetical protein